METLGSPGALQTYIVRLGKVWPGSTRKWGKMTPHEMICDLTDSFDLALGGKSASSASGLFQRTVMKWGALYFPLEWPKGVPTRPEMEQGTGRAFGAKQPGDFEHDRARLIELMARFAACTDFADRFHPIFGTMTAVQWQRWGLLHADHHLRQFGV